MMQKVKKILFAVGSAVLPLVAMASNEPLDLSATGTTLAGYIATAAGAALAVFLGWYGIRVIMKSFKDVGTLGKPLNGWHGSDSEYECEHGRPFYE